VPTGVRFRDDSAAFAPNWRLILAVDLAMGAAVFAAGLILAFTSSGWGWPLAVLGFVYLFFVGGRVAKWRRMRRQAGL
jgi:hypothetical protein